MVRLVRLELVSKPTDARVFAFVCVSATETKKATMRCQHMSEELSRIERALAKRFGESVALPKHLEHPQALAAILERSVCRDYQDKGVPSDLGQLLCRIMVS